MLRHDANEASGLAAAPAPDLGRRPETTTAQYHKCSSRRERRLTVGTYWSLAGMTIAAIGFYGSKGPFWAMPPMFVTGMTAAATIAWINLLGNLGGFFGPSIVGWVRELTGSFAGGLYALAGFALMAAIVAALWLHIPRHAVASEVAPAPAE